jgi:hypothetical protein
MASVNETLALCDRMCIPSATPERRGRQAGRRLRVERPGNSGLSRSQLPRRGWKGVVDGRGERSAFAVVRVDAFLPQLRRDRLREQAGLPGRSSPKESASRRGAKAGARTSTTLRPQAPESWRFSEPARAEPHATGLDLISSKRKRIRRTQDLAHARAEGDRRAGLERRCVPSEAAGGLGVASVVNECAGALQMYRLTRLQ